MNMRSEDNSSIRLCVLVLLALWCIHMPVRASGSSGTIAAGLRGLPGAMIDGARLLEQFGEVERAYDLIRQACPDDTEMSLMENELTVRLLTKLGLYERADKLLSYRNAPDAPLDLCRYYLHRARLNYLAGHYGLALEYLSRSEGVPVESYADYRELVRMQALARLERFDEAADVGLRLLDTGYLPSLTPEFEENLMFTLMRAERYEDAVLNLPDREYAAG